MPSSPNKSDTHDLPEGEPLVLSEREREAFFEALTNPPEPNERLMRAMADHKRHIGSAPTPAPTVEQVEQLHGFMRETVVIPPDVDLTAPILEQTDPVVRYMKRNRGKLGPDHTLET